MAPFRLAAEAQTYLLRHPLNPLSYTHGGRAMAAVFELFDDGTKPRRKPNFGIRETRIGEARVPVRERIVMRKPFCQLKRFDRGDAPAAKGQPRVLLVAPLSGHFATLMRGTVQALVPGHDVYVTDWRDAKQVPLRAGGFDLDDYVDYLMAFLRHLGPGTHVIGVCQPAVPVLAATALMGAAGDKARPASMTLMGGPIDTRINPTVPNKFAKQHSLAWFRRTLIQRVPPNYRGAMRAVYPGFLQLSGFLSMNLDRHVGAHMRHFHHLVRGDGDSAAAHRKFYDEYRSVMDLDADYYLQTIERVFQQHQLAVGSFRYRGDLVEPAAITDCALMTVEGEKDDISGIGQTRAAHELCSSLPARRKSHWEQPGVGHYGVFNGRRWRQEIAPRVAAFIARHNG